MKVTDAEAGPANASSPAVATAPASDAILNRRSKVEPPVELDSDGYVEQPRNLLIT
jgi:hypothetical protein